MQTIIIERIKEESNKIKKMVKKLDIVTQRKLDNIKDSQEKANNEQKKQEEDPKKPESKDKAEKDKKAEKAAPIKK